MCQDLKLFQPCCRLLEFFSICHKCLSFPLIPILPFHQLPFFSPMLPFSSTCWESINYTSCIAWEPCPCTIRHITACSSRDRLKIIVSWFSFPKAKKPRNDFTGIFADIFNVQWPHLQQFIKWVYILKSHSSIQQANLTEINYIDMWGISNKRNDTIELG